ncbi:hypothetical protein [Hahella sp. HN01]|uniref:hypothetical protein n=1 Tax=Hahella sp. HN01 TaxID=2847262 RepID=UPI001C1EF416|nr:hypothetical protein [Hahella sp. HN01]MBU6955765.1 hypothetical protein [Hahella sp. HN01]
MGKTVRTLLQEIDSAELAEWMAYESLDAYAEQFERERQSSAERSDALKNLLFGDAWRDA